MNAHVIKPNTHSTTMLLKAKEEKVMKNRLTISPRGLENHSQRKAIGTKQIYGRISPSANLHSDPMAMPGMGSDDEKYS